MTMALGTLAVLAAEKLPRTEALGIAMAVAGDLKSLQDTPIPTDVDLKHPVVVRDGDAGALVLPECKLSTETLQKAGDTVAPIGQLWLHQLCPLLDGKTVEREKLRLVPVYLSEGEVTAVQCALGVQKSGAGELELTVFGKSKAASLKLPLKKVEAKSKAPIEVDLVAAGDSDKFVVVTILGQYQARIPVAAYMP